MPSKLILVCFDINGEYEYLEEKSIVTSIIDLESPSRIFDEFFETNLFLESNKKQGKAETKYSLTSYKVSKNKLINYDIYIFSDLSFVHNVSLSADCNLVFTNLENEKSFERLDKLFTYLKELCLIEIKTYVVGVFYSKILPNMKMKNMKEFFKCRNYECEYYQACCDPEYFNEKKKNKDDDDKLGFNIEGNKNNFENYENILIVIHKILKKIYKEKICDSVQENTGRKKDDNSKSKCIIF